MPRISIVTPTYQQASTIRETIESVLAQDHANLDYRVLDGGSTDGTVEILRSYENDPRFHWVSEPDKGQSDAINKGLARCTGEIFNWINSDDYLEPGALRKVAEAFGKSPGLDIVSGRTAEFRGDPPEIFNRIQLQLRATAEQSIPVGVFCQPSTFWRTEIVRALGGRRDVVALRDGLESVGAISRALRPGERPAHRRSAGPLPASRRGEDEHRVGPILRRGENGL